MERNRILLFGYGPSFPNDSREPTCVRRKKLSLGSATPTYANLISAGYTDVWPLVTIGDPGFSAGISADLLGPVSALKSRIDLVLFRGAISAVRASLVGNKESDRTPSGLLPSDHAGLVATVRLGVK